MLTSFVYTYCRYSVCCVYITKTFHLASYKKLSYYHSYSTPIYFTSLLRPSAKKGKKKHHFYVSNPRFCVWTEKKEEKEKRFYDSTDDDNAADEQSTLFNFFGLFLAKKKKEENIIFQIFSNVSNPVSKWRRLSAQSSKPPSTKVQKLNYYEYIDIRGSSDKLNSLEKYSFLKIAFMTSHETSLQKKFFSSFFLFPSLFLALRFISPARVFWRMFGSFYQDIYCQLDCQ